MDLSHGSCVVFGQLTPTFVGHVFYKPQRCYCLKQGWVRKIKTVIYSVGLCVTEHSLCSGEVCRKRKTSPDVCVIFFSSSVVCLLFFDSPVIPSPSKRAIFYCVLVRFYWNRNWQRRHMDGLWNSKTDQSWNGEWLCLWYFIQLPTRAVKLNVSIDQVKRVFHVLFHLSAVQKHVMQCNFCPITPGLVLIMWDWD